MSPTKKSAKPTAKVPVTRRAVLQRIQRALASEGEAIKTSRGERALQELGEYYLIDVNRNAVLAKHVKLEELANELKVLKPFEAVADED